MKQAKLRSSGSNLSRSDVVMVLMEEAIARATAEIETRFATIEKEQGLEPEKPTDQDDSALESKEDEIDTGESIFKLFGLIKQRVMPDEVIVKVSFLFIIIIIIIITNIINNFIIGGN